MITRKEEQVLSSDQKYQLKQHDVIKLGRTLLRVKTLFPVSENDKELANLKVKDRVASADQQYNENVDLLSNQGEMEADIEGGTMKETEMAPGSDNVCRICYCGLATTDNPLVSLCKCTGSMRYTHYSCIKNWMDSKLYEKKNEVYTFVSFKNLKCEICKVDFPCSCRSPRRHRTQEQNLPARRRRLAIGPLHHARDVLQRKGLLRVPPQRPLRHQDGPRQRSHHRTRRSPREEAATRTSSSTTSPSPERTARSR